MDKIIYLARKLKTFDFDEIFLLAEIPKQTLMKYLEELVETGELKKLKTGYVYTGQSEILNKKNILPQKNVDYGMFLFQNTKTENLSFCEIVKKFLNNYVAKFCTNNTVKTYTSLFKNNILPYFKNKGIENISVEDIKDFFLCCKSKNMSARRLKNTLALLRQLLCYAKDNGFTNQVCNFQVKRISAKNEFDLNRVIFE